MKLFIMFMIIVFAGCDDSDPFTPKKKEPPVSKSSALLWWFLSPLTPDRGCYPTDTFTDGLLLEKNKKYKSNKSESFQIVLDKNASISPIHLRITLLENNCTITRGTGYCHHFKEIFGTLSNSEGISCNDETISNEVPISGSIGTFEDCILSYDSAKIGLDITPRPIPTNCIYEVYYY